MYLLAFVLTYITGSEILVECSGQSADSKKQVIVIAVPGESDDNYDGYFQILADFAMQMDEKTKGRDHLFIIHDDSGPKYFKNYTFTNGHLIKVEKPLDPWLRDFPPTMPKQQVKFTYRPRYLTPDRAKLDSINFKKFAVLVGLPSLQHSDIVLEGGNIVENGVDAAITTERVYKDNPNMTKAKLVQSLEASIKRKVCVVLDPGDATGHADGLVSFVEEDVLLIGSYKDDPKRSHYFDTIRDTVLKVFPNLTIVPLPSYAKNVKTYGFETAEGCYANALVTNNAIYLPFFTNRTNNERAFGVFKNSSSKEVIPVYNFDKVAILGGSLRCLTWQIDQDHPVAKRLFAYVEERSGTLALTARMTLVALILQLSWFNDCY